MPEFARRRLLPFRDRQALLDRHRELDAAANQVDCEQRRLAEEFSSLRRELRTVRDKLWPASPRRAFRTARRPRLPGPSPIPPPVDGAQPIRGRDLRYSVLAVLARSGTALTLPEIHRALHLRGFVIGGQHPVKTLGDALAYECRQGRVRRTARGTYVIGELSPARRRRALAIRAAR
jgi:hypothetical protein